MTGTVTPLHADLRGLRILMTVDAVGGVWRYAMDLAAGLRAAGCEIVFAGFGPPPDAAMLAEAARHGTVGWSPAPLDWMARDAAALHPAQEALARLCRDRRADLVHLNAPPLAAGPPLGAPVVAVAHSCLATWQRAVRGLPLPAAEAWHADRYRAGMEAAAAVVAPSVAQAALMAECYPDLPRLRIVHNGVALPAPMPEVAREPFALAAGRWWDEGKNLATLDAAAAGMAVPLRLAGPVEGPNGTAAAPRHAKALGPLPNAGLRALMARAAVFVAPSRYEPFGLAVVEAAQAGLPLVLADIPTFRELWTDASAAFVPPGDAAGFAAAVNRLAADPVTAARMGAAARAHATRYRPARQVAGMAAVYRAALTRARDRQRAALP